MLNNSVYQFISRQQIHAMTSYMCIKLGKHEDFDDSLQAFAMISDLLKTGTGAEKISLFPHVGVTIEDS